MIKPNQKKKRKELRKKDRKREKSNPEGERNFVLLRREREGALGSLAGVLLSLIYSSDSLNIDKARTEQREALRGFGAREGRTERQMSFRAFS